MSTWRPILESPHRERALATAVALADLVASADAGHTGQASYSGGRAGMALLHAYLGRAGLGRHYVERAAAFLKIAIEAVATTPMSASLYSGFTGVAWTVEHLRSLFKSSDHDPNEQIDEVLLELVQDSPWLGEYDVIGGIVGVGVYGLERAARGVPTGAHLVEQVVARLSETAEARGDGATWRTRPEWMGPENRENFPMGNYNLGVAHGVPGIIAFLAMACNAGVSTRTTRELLERAMRWVLASRLSAELQNKSGAIFGYNEGEPYPARTAWCYGDPGVATALLQAARATNSAAWETIALDAALASARRPDDKAGVVDASICHGAAGNGHLFNRLWHATGNDAFLVAARHCFDKTLAMRDSSKGLGGYPTWVRDKYVDDAGLLTGITGVALGLVAAATSVLPDWDRPLLTNLRPAGFD